MVRKLSKNGLKMVLKWFKEWSKNCPKRSKWYENGLKMVQHMVQRYKNGPKSKMVQKLCSNGVRMVRNGLCFENG